MHQAALISMGSADAARFFSWIILLASVVILAGIVRLVGVNQRGQLISGILLVTSSGVVWFFGEGKVDIYAISFARASIVLVLFGKFPFIAGLMFGYGVLAKNPYIVSLAPLLGIILLWRQLFSPKTYNKNKIPNHCCQ